jgi:GT2 family glycosyltransferase/capsular polysaccharide biosynthesis protein
VVSVSDIEQLENPPKKSIIQLIKQKVSIIIMMHNNLQLNQLCIDNIRKYTEQGIYEIIVVDNASKDGSTQWLKQQTDIKCIYNEQELGYSTCYNQGIEIAYGENLLLLSSAIIVTSNWLNNLLTALYSDENIGAVSPLTNNYTNQDTLYQYTSIVELQELAIHNNVSNNASWEDVLHLESFCILVKKKIMKNIGRLDQAFTIERFVNKDFVLRIKENGYKIILCKDTFVHQEIDVIKDEVLNGNRVNFYEKWKIETFYIEIIKSKNFHMANVLQIECNGGETLLNIKSTLPQIKCYGLTSSKLFSKSEGITIIHTSEPYDYLEYFRKRQFDIIIINNKIEYNTDITQLLHSVIYYCDVNGYIFLKIPKKIFFEFKILKHQNFFNIECSLGEAYIVAFTTQSLNGNYLRSVLKNIESDINIEENYQFIYKSFLSKNCSIRHICEIINKYIVKKVKVLSCLAEITSKACDSDSELLLWNLAYQLEPKNIKIVQKLVTLLQKHNLLERILLILNLIDRNELNEELAIIREDVLAKIETEKNTINMKHILTLTSIFERVDNFLYKRKQDPWYFEKLDNKKKILLQPPVEYIGELHNVLVVGGTRFIFDEKQYLYHDDLAATYKINGFRPRLTQHVKVLGDDKVALMYKKNETYKKIKKGILISSEYDFSYGHWMIECLPKILFIKEKIGLDEIPLLVGSDAHPYYLELINIICKNTDYSIVKLEKGYGYEVETLIYPSDVSFIPELDGRSIADGEFVLSAKWIKRLQEVLVGEFESNELRRDKKIYLTRRNFLGRKLLNELEIEIELKKRGFEIIDLTSFSHEERKELLGQAKLVVGAIGSADFNMLYCRPGTKCISFASDAFFDIDGGNGISYQLFNIYQLSHRSICGTRAYRYNHCHDDFTLPVEILLNCINEVESSFEV